MVFGNGDAWLELDRLSRPGLILPTIRRRPSLGWEKGSNSMLNYSSVCQGPMSCLSLFDSFDDIFALSIAAS